MRTNVPTLVNIMKKPTITAARNAELRNKPGETKGSGAERMRHTKPTAATTDSEKLPQVTGDVKPATWPSVTPKSASPAAEASKSPPGTSNL